MHREPMTGLRANRRGAVDVKTIAALVFALAGLSWAALSLMGGRDEAEPSGPRVIASALDDEGNAVEPEYTSTSGSKRLGAAATQIDEIVRTGATTALGAITAPKGTPEGVGEAVVHAFVPLVKGDQDAFWEAIAAMGGQVPGEIDGEHPMFKSLKKEFEGAKVDFSRIRVRKYEAPKAGMRGGRMTRDVDEQQGEGGPSMRTQRMEMRPESIFPDAPQATDPSAIEVTIPVQPKGEELETIFGLVLTWNKDLKLWQPASYGVIKNRLVEEEG